MASSSRRRAPPPPPSRLRAIADKLETPRVLIALVTAAWVLISLVGGSVYSWGEGLWQHWTGSQVAHELRPEVAALKGLATETSALAAQVAERTNSSEERLKKAETTLDEIRQIKAIEQERTQAVEQAQRSACLTGSLTADACDRLGYPRPVAAK